MPEIGLEFPLSELYRGVDFNDIDLEEAAVPELEVWLKAVAAAWTRLDPDLLEVARNMGCDQGRFIRRPRGFRPLTEGEVAQQEAVAAFHLSHPRPDGWVAEREVSDPI